jgi:HPt (histidine-containing phosphotransfer) domain-containing protein
MTYELDPDADLPPHLLQLFLRAAPVQLAVLVERVQRREVDGARLAAHKFKGGLFAAGASSLAQTVETLRATLAREEWANVERQLQAIRDDFSRLVATLQRRLEGREP